MDRCPRGGLPREVETTVGDKANERWNVLRPEPEGEIIDFGGRVAFLASEVKELSERRGMFVCVRHGWVPSLKRSDVAKVCGRLMGWWFRPRTQGDRLAAPFMHVPQEPPCTARPSFLV